MATNNVLQVSIMQSSVCAYASSTWFASRDLFFLMYTSQQNFW